MAGMAPKVKVEGNPPAAEKDTSSNVEQIRDIIFGGQMREYEKRFAEIEERLFRESAAMREELSERLTRLEAAIYQELKKLGESGLRERSERLQTTQSLENNVASLGENLNAQLKSLDQRSSQNLGEARQQLQDKLSAAIAKATQQLQDLDQRLGHDKAGRVELATLLTDLAQRLKPPAD